MNSKKFNVLFLGERKLAEICLKILEVNYKDKFNIKALSTNNFFFRGYLKEFKQSNDVEFICNSTRNENKLIDVISKHEINLIISVQHLWIISNIVLQKVGYNAFNLHNARIPNYRGHNTISHAVINKETTYTSTIHRMIDKVDQGRVIEEVDVKINSDDTAYDLYLKTLNNISPLFTNFIEKVLVGDLEGKPVSDTNIGRFYNKDDLSEKTKASLNFPKEFRNIINGAFFPPYNFTEVDIGNEKFCLIPKKDISDHLKSYKKINLSSWELSE